MSSETERRQSVVGLPVLKWLHHRPVRPAAAPPTYDLSGEGAAGDVVFVVFDQDVVVSGQSGHVADAARPVLVVHTVDLCLGRPLDGQVQATCNTHTNQLKPVTG